MNLPTRSKFAPPGLLATLWPLVTTAATTVPAHDRPLEQIIVVAPHGATIDRDRLPAYVQSATAKDIERAESLDLTDFLNRNFSSVHINHAQNNPLQPDLNFRGFTASPLLGLPQGMAVYQDGMRANEPFGDAVNWDLIPLSGVASVQLLAGSNPVFGLNTLGGALVVQMKTGFDASGTSLDAYAGSFERRGVTLQTGANDGRWGYYFNLDYFEEDGWRDHSASDALRGYGALSLRTEATTLDLRLSHATSDLRGNGASPVELLALDRAAVFTYPDITENRLTQLIVDATQRLDDRMQLAANAYVRVIDTDTFNGDGTIFEECEFGDDELLVEEDFDDLNGDGQCSAAYDAGIVPVLDTEGLPVDAELDGEELDAINNLGQRSQTHYGVSLQMSVETPLSDERQNDFVVGAAYTRGDTEFDSSVEVAQLLDDRSTSRTGIYAAEYATDVDSDISTWSAYFSDTYDVTQRLSVTLAGRYNVTEVQLDDTSGRNPELEGRHQFERFNASLGLSQRLGESMVWYANVGQSTRAPTPVELACASEDAPCNLPNAFLADPPLDQVVATSAELGVRGEWAHGLRWRAGAFHTVNDDDILFQTTGGAQANVGFFDNVGDTRRAGVEVELAGTAERLSWSVEYSYIDAVFADSFVVNSPNHPAANGELDDRGLSVGDGKLQVPGGAQIPGIPQHQANAVVDYRFGDHFTAGADVSYRSGVYLRGDEPNLMARTDGYVVTNLRFEYRLSDAVTLHARVENLFDEDYESFGLLGEPEEVFPEFEDPRFLGAGPPLGAWVGVRWRLP